MRAPVATSKIEWESVFEITILEESMQSSPMMIREFSPTITMLPLLAVQNAPMNTTPPDPTILIVSAPKRL